MTKKNSSLKHRLEQLLIPFCVVLAVALLVILSLTTQAVVLVSTQ